MKYIIVDTNIILNDVESVVKLSDKKDNIIIITDTVLNELDKFKTNFDEIGYQAREFMRVLERSVIKKTKKIGDILETFIENDDVIFIVTTKDVYKSDKPDDKIIEIVLHYKELYRDVVFYTQDINCRLVAISRGIKAKPFKINNKNIYSYKTQKIYIDEVKPSYTFNEVKGLLNEPDRVHGFILNDAFPYYRVSNCFLAVDEKDLKRTNVKPKNNLQKIAYSLMLEESIDIVAMDAPAGSGKTLLAIGAAMALIDRSPRYDNIVYIRKTILSDDADLGALPGTLNEKMLGYLAPLYTNIETIVENKYPKKKKDEREFLVEEIFKKYNIESHYIGHLRGSNIKNAVVILDEFQNNNLADAKTILTRINDGCKVIAIGSINQIDNKYINIHNNMLTFLLNAESEDVRIAYASLEKIERGRIAEWAENAF